MSFLLFALSSPSGTEGGPSLFTSLIPILLIFVIFYFLLIRPQQRKQKQHQEMVANLRKGDKIVTNGGIYGTVSDVKEHVIVLRISEDVKIEVVKSAVATIIEKRED
ncbi:MAG: preprotein translocase subunit YajC [bacterium]|nr:MAG: preprotein translocase subunit YajC [bacterium]